MLNVLMQEDITVILEQLHTSEEMLDKYHAAANKNGVEAYESFLWVTDKQMLLQRFEERQSGPTKH